MTINEFLRRICTALEVNHVDYMVTGSFASAFYGEPRSSNDLDVVIAPSRAQLFALIQLFKRIGFYARLEDAEVALQKHDQFNVIDFATGWKVDLIVRKSRDFSVTEFDRRGTAEIEGSTISIAKPEDVVISKLEWAKIGESERQLEDVAGIIRMQGDTLDTTYIESWLESLGLEKQWLIARQMAEK